jgi:hypothetical protein
MKKAKLITSSLCLILALSFTVPVTVYAADDGPQGGSNSTKVPPPPPPPPSSGLLGILVATLIALAT